MLDTAVRTFFNPGSNLKGQVAGANWSFLLPAMNLDRILYFGNPSHRTLETLSHLSRKVFVISQDQDFSLAHSQEQGNNIALVYWEPDEISIPIGVPKALADLIIINGRNMIQKFTSNSGLRPDLLRLLGPRGWIYLELNGWFDLLTTKEKARQLASRLGKAHFFWSSPLLGEIHTAVPDQDRETIQYFIRQGLYQPESKTHLLAQAKRHILKLLINKKFIRRQSILVSRENGFDFQAPPEYLRTLAAQAGVDLQYHRWGLVAHGEYSTRKVLFYLFRSSDPSPEFIVKLVRNAAYNARLENEHHALSSLWEKGVGIFNFLPKPAFFGYHNGLAILGETAIAGKSFRKVAGDNPDSALARLAVQHLTELGAATMDPYSMPTAQAAETIMQLCETFNRIFQPAPEVQAFLGKQINSIASRTGVFPLVFQHGDPGAWNILVSAKGEVFFLDWESAEPNGVPLWDLFYFLRSYAVGLARKAGTRDALVGFERQFFGDHQFRDFANQALRGYCEKLNLPVELVEPLFYTCWMHRSLKEANRLGLHQLQNSHYYKLLLFCIQKRETQPMIHLLSAGYGSTR